jgi:hypothetical protein
MTQQEYEELKAARRAQFDADIEAIERVWRMYQEREDASYFDSPDQSERHEDRTRATSQNGTPTRGRPSRKGSVIAAVQEAIDKGPDRFTTLDMVNRVSAMGLPADRPSIKSVLIRLERKGVIETAVRGIGRKPSVYRKKTATH